MLKKLKMFLAVFPRYFGHEFIRFLNKWNLMAWLIIFILMFLSVNHGVDENLALPGKVRQFQDIQNEYFRKTSNYEVYGRDGIRLLFMYSNAAVFSGYAAVPPDLAIHFDSIVMLNIENNYKGKSLARGVFQDILGFQCIVMILVSFLFILYGFPSSGSPEYMRFHSGLKPGGNVFWPIVVSRLLLAILLFTILNALLYGYVRVRGIDFTPGDQTGLLVQLAAALVMLTVFFSLGVFIGSRKQTMFSYLILFIAWLILVLIIPGILGSWVEKKLPDAIEDYQIEMENYKIVVDLEKYCESIAGPFNRNNIELIKKLIEVYWERYKKEIKRNEDKLKVKTELTFETLDKFSLLCPTTFYMNTCSETSSRGYRNYIDFYNYGQDMKLRFVRFYFDRTIYNDPKVMVSFIQGNENIFKGTSRVPPYFLFGLLFHMSLALLLLILSSFNNHRGLYPQAKKSHHYRDIKLDFDRKLITLSVNFPEFVRQLVNEVFREAKKLPWEITIGKEAPAGLRPGECLYLVNPAHLPGELKPRRLLRLCQRMLNLPEENISKVKAEFGKELLNTCFSGIDTVKASLFLLALAEMIKPKILILSDFAQGIPINKRGELADRVEKLKECCTTIIDIVTTECYWLEADKRITIGFDDDKYKVIS